jgi:hypothetical protein
MLSRGDTDLLVADSGNAFMNLRRLIGRLIYAGGGILTIELRGLGGGNV